MLYDLAIVGTGFTGACFFIHYAQLPNNRLQKIVLIDPYVTGRGPAYQKNDFGFLLNVPAFRMSLFPDDPLHFVNWLKKNNYQFGHYDFVPRSIYGDYVEDLLQQSLQLFPNIKLIKDSVIAVKSNKEIFSLKSTSDELIEAKRVVLSIGSPPPSIPVAMRDLHYDKNYISNPHIIPLLKKIDKNETVFILGKGLTSLDLLSIFKNHESKVILQSRNGRLPRPHLPLTDELVKYQANIHFSFSEKPTILEIMDKFKQKTRQEKVPWQIAMDVLRHQVAKIWPKLSIKDKKRFLFKLKPLWNVHRHRSPQISLEQVDKNLKANKLELIKGEVTKVAKNADEFEITIQSKQSQLIRKAKWIINATGPNYNIGQHPSPLIQQLLKDKILKSDTMNFGIELNEDHELLKNLYFIGPLTLSRYLESTSVPDLRNQAKTFAQKLSV